MRLADGKAPEKVLTKPNYRGMPWQMGCSVDKCRVTRHRRHDLNYLYTQMGSELIVTFQQKD